MNDKQIEDMASVMRDGAYRMCEEITAKLNRMELDDATRTERYQHWSGIKHGLPTKRTLAELLFRELKP